MADNTQGIPVISKAGEFLLTKLVDTAGTNQAAISAANALKVDGSAVTQPVSDAGGSLTVDGSVSITGAVDTELPAAAALTDNFANPTAPAVGAFGMAWDGATWDRMKGDSTDGLLVNLGANNDVTFAGTVTVAGVTAADAALTANPVTTGGRASSATPTAMSADGDVVNQWLDLSGGTIVNGRDAHDAALNANTNPVLTGGRASAAAPTDVSADGDAVRAWFLRNGAAATVLTAAGALIGGDAANGLDVDVTRVTGTVTVDSELPAAAALADATANPTVPGVGSFLLGFNGTTWDRVRTANTGRLQVDVITGGSGGTQYVGDAAATATPTGTMDMGLANAAAPTDVSANNDAVAMWMLRNGSPVMNIASGGTLVTVGQKVSASSLPVVIASDQSNINVVLTAGTNTNEVVGDVAQDAAIAGNPLSMGGRASTATPTAMSADGDSVYAWLDRSGGTIVNGRDAHDAALDANTNPQLIGGRASAAAPTDVSADGDATRIWVLRSGAQAAVLTAAGALIGGDAANGLDVDVTRVTGTVTVDSELPAAAALADATANPTVPGVGGFLMGYNGTTWDRVRTANTGRLQVDVITGGSGGTQYVGDAAATATPTGTMGMGLANAAAPSDVSANNDAVAMWMLRNGSPVVNLASGGTLITIGQKTMANSMPMVIASDQTVIPVSDNAGSLTVDNGGTFSVQDTQTITDNAAFTDGTSKVLMAGFAFDDVAGTALTENDAAAARIDTKRAQVLVLEDATTRNQKAAISAAGALASNLTQIGGNTVVTGGVNGTLAVGGVFAHDAAAATALPVGIGAFASAAAPADVSADGDSVKIWALRNGAQAMVLTAAGALIGGDAANGLDVDVTRVTGTVTVDSELPAAAALADATANPTVPGVGAFNMGFNGTTWDRVRTANTGRLQVDVITGGSGSGLVSPKFDYATSSSLGAGAAVDIDFDDIGGTTGDLHGLDVWSAAPLKVEIRTVTGGTPTTRVVIGATPGVMVHWRAPHQSYITHTAGAGNFFRARVTNLGSQASDVHATAYWDQI